MQKILRLLFCQLLIFYSFGSFSQEKGRYWVFFTDKKGTNFDPESYYDKKAIDRRIKTGVSLNDSISFPVKEEYVSAVKKISGIIYTESRWINAVTTSLTDDECSMIESLPFVSEIRQVEVTGSQFSEKEGLLLNSQDSFLLASQIKQFNGYEFISRNINGKGIRIAVFDGGFKGVDKNPVFRHLLENKQIIKTYDFVSEDENVYHYMTHGTMVLACIAGIFQNRLMGLAPEAEFLLARTEVRREARFEEENWLKAAEWADKNGADIINSSLGYTYNRYFPSDMNGTTSLVSKAAAIASSRGMLVINSMGNDGNGSWEFVSTPADAQSVLSVGGINPASGYHISFSSYGPTADMRMKPNVSAYAGVISATPSKLKKVFGTSFSSPLVAGFAACVWQLNPEYTNSDVFNAIEESARLYPYYDYAHGYGTPDASFFFQENEITTEPFHLNECNNELSVEINQIPLQEEHDLLYYHIENKDKYLDYYAVIEVEEKIPLIIDLTKINKNSTIRFHYKGCTKSFLLK